MTTSVNDCRQLVESCQGLVRSLAVSIHKRLPSYVELDDLIGYGQVGLAEAAKEFDPSRGGRFSTFAYYRVRGAIYDGLSKMSWFSRSQYHQIRYERMAAATLEVHNQTDATEEKSPEGDMRWLRDLSRSLAVVYLTAHGEDASLNQQISLTESARFAPPLVAMGQEVVQRLREAIETLPADEGALIKSTYFEGETLQDAGRRLGISKSWATRLHARALQRLGRSLRLLGLDPAS